MDNNRKVVELPLDDVLPNRFQPRIKFNEESISELAESIKEHGVIQPIVVRPVGDRYEIIAGERRYKATTLAGLQTIPAIITDLNDKDSAEVALIENVQRQDLTPIEEAISYKKILDMGYLTQDNLAEKLGKTQSTVANKLRLLNLDEDVQEALLNEKISERHARSLLKLPDSASQVKLLNKIINERLTVRKTDEEINKMLNANNNQTIDNNVEVLDFEEPVIIPEEPTVISNIPTSPIINDDKVEEIKPFNFESGFLSGQNEPEEPAFADLLKAQEEKTEEAPEDTIIPGKFFNILDETDDLKQEPETFKEEPAVNTDFNFDDMFIPQGKEEVPAANSVYNNMPEFPMPSIANEVPPAVETKQEATGTNTYVTADIKTIVNTIRNCADTIEKYGFNVDTEEFDLDDMYQVIFKVYKK